MDIDTRIAADWAARANTRMKALTLTYTDLSREAGYASFLQTKRHLTGTSTPEWSVLCSYARALQCSPEWLARAEGEYPIEAKVVRLRAVEDGVKAMPAAVEPEIGLRFRKARAAVGKSQVDLAKQVKASKQLISKLELGEIRDPHCRVLFHYEDATGYNGRWLVLGRGPELRGATSTKLNADILDHATRLIDEALTRMRLDSIPRRARTRITAVLYDQISAGQPPNETLVDTLVRAMG